MHKLPLVVALVIPVLASSGVGQQGPLYSWGSDVVGQVSDTPIGATYVQFASGCSADFSLALRSDGTIVAWGEDYRSQVSNTPTGQGFSQIACGASHALALRTDGSIVSWGDDSFGQVSNTPVGTGFIQVAGGGRFSLALRTDGSIAVWGSDALGQISNAPAGVGFTQIVGGETHAIAIKSDSSLVSWGSDYVGEVSHTPPGPGFVQVSAGESHSHALRTDGGITSWGSNGDGLVSNTPSGNNFVQVVSGYRHAHALRIDGSVTGWGQDNGGVVSTTPGGTGFTRLTGGRSHSMAQEASQGNPPSGYDWVQHPSNGKSYALTAPVNWSQAKAEADALGLNISLVTIRDVGENAWIQSSLTMDSAWIGFSDEVLEGAWTWLSAEPVTYTNWAPGMPDNFGPSGQDAAQINPVGSIGMWDDVGIDWIGPAILEYGDEDSDEDGLLDDDEASLFGTDPEKFDSDGDGLGDGQELGVTYATAPSDTDQGVFSEDTDPLTTTNPLLYDTDGGGTSDGNEDVDKNGAIDVDEGDPDDPLDDLFQLSVLGLSPGQQATISVWECRPGSVVVPLFSMAGQTTRLFPDYNHLELALSNPINQLTGMTAGPGGTAFSTIWVPPYVSIGVTVYWQAVEITAGGDAYRPSIPIIAVVQ